MDFPKTCSTNVLRVNNILAYTYATHECQGRVDSIISSLRQSDVLCSLVDTTIWTFNQADHLSDSVAALQLQERGTLQERLDKDGNDKIVDLFISAVKAGLAFKLASQKRIYALGSDTWIDAPDHNIFAHGCSVWHLSAKQISGSLQFTTTPAKAQICPLSTLPTPAGARLSLCPSGVRAVLVEHPSQDSQHYPALPSVVEQEWRLALQAKLLLEGISLDASTDWTDVQLEDDSLIAFSWPTELCFVNVRSPAEDQAPSVSGMQDPLAFAEHWAESTTERQQAILLEQHGRAVQTGPVGFTTDEMDLIASPPLLIRPDLVNAAGVYPTPPDGMLLPTATQLTSQIESTMPSQQDAVPDSDELFRLQTHDGEDAMNVREGRDSIVSSMRDNVQHAAQDDLFGGPVGEYGGGEVEDNDFDFFDDQTAGMLTSHSVPASLDHEPSMLTSTPQDLKTQLDSDIVMTDVASTPFTTGDTSVMDAEEAPAAPSSLLVTPAEIAPKYKPLSPFEIRERLLPPPIPASQASQAMPEVRRGSFAPIKFNPDLHLGTRLQPYLQRDASNVSLTDASDHEASHGSPTRADAASSPTKAKVESEWSDSDDDTSDDATKHQQVQLPQLPWQARKRKRVASVDDVNISSWTVQAMPSEPESAMHDVPGLLARTMTLHNANISPARPQSAPSDRLKKYFSNIKPFDLLIIAQVIAGQAVSCTTRFLADLESPHDERDGAATHQVEYAIVDALQHFLNGAKDIDLGSLALQRELPRLEPSKSQPRPPLRLETTPPQELYPVPAPYICLQRGDTAMQMLPPAVHFWESLSLGPSNGSKDMQPYYISPNNPDLIERLKGFNDDLRTAYEGCKLGNVRDASTVLTFWSGSADGSDDESLYCDYLKLCKGLITALAEEAYKDPSETSIIFVVDPFNNRNKPFQQLVAALFWKIYAGYREKIARGKSAKDITLQLLPASMVYSPDRLSFMSSNQMAVLARELYDRCPPGEQFKQKSPLPIATAASLFLAEALPKRIGFQVTASTPADLLHDGSELHVAYARSQDGLWITTVWVDNTGSCLHSDNFCLRGTSVARTFAEIWTRTLDIVAKRPVSWRISIATEHVLSEGDIQCWKEVLLPPKQKRCGVLHVSLVAVRANSALRVKAPADRDGAQTAVTAGVITPVGTPQASGFTVSPDASGVAAPPTPAPTEPSAEETDAYLVDLQDETWAMLLDPKYDLIQGTSCDYEAMAQGALVKYGDKESSADLPVLGMSILFTLRIRWAAATVPMEDATPKLAEVVLKELMTAFRGLALLAKVRGLQYEERIGIPVHVLGAAAAAEALDGLLA